jgi:MFS family permease
MSRPAGPWSGWWMVFVLLALNIMSLVDRNIINMLVVPIQRDLHITDVQMGLVLGPVFAIAYLVCGLPFGWAADRYPRRVVIFAGSMIWSAALTVGGFAKGFPGLVMSRAFVGAGEAALSPTAFSLIGDGLPRSRMTTALALYSMGPKLAQAAAFLIGGWLIGYAAHHSLIVPLIGELTSWRLVLFMIGAPGLFLSLLVFTFSEPDRKGSKNSDEPVPPIIPFLKSEWQLITLLLLGAAAAGVMYATMLAWLPTFMTRKFGWEPPQFGPVLFWVGVVGAFSVIVKGMIVDWLGKRGMTDAPLRFYSWLIAIAVPATLIAFTTGNPYISMVGYGVADIVSSAVPMYVAATIQIYFPAEFRGRLNALQFMTITILAAGGGPLLVAMLTQEVFQDPAAIGQSLRIVTASAAVISLICFRLVLRRLPSSPPGSSAAPSE